MNHTMDDNQTGLEKNLRSQPDERLITKVLARDHDAFEKLMRRYDGALKRYVSHMIRHDHDTPDIIQEIWLKVYEHLGELKTPRSFSTWLFAIARNHCLYHLGRSRGPVSYPYEQSNIIHPNDEHVRRARRRRVLRAISGLSKILRNTVTLHYISGYSCSEVSHRLNVPVGTVKRRLADARKQLKVIFQDWYQHPGSDTPWALDH